MMLLEVINFNCEVDVIIYDVPERTFYYKYPGDMTITGVILVPCVTELKFQTIIPIEGYTFFSKNVWNIEQFFTQPLRITQSSYQTLDKGGQEVIAYPFSVVIPTQYTDERCRATFQLEPEIAKGMKRVFLPTKEN